MLSQDHLSSYGYSVMGWLNTWFHLEIPKNLVVGIGILIFLIPLLRIKMYRDYNFRLLALASVLLWIVLFNHKAESPTFIIAMTGIAIWFSTSTSSPLRIALILFALLFTSLITTDIFPRSIRTEFFQPYVIKVLPSILIWGVVIYEMLIRKKEDNTSIPSVNDI